MASTASLPLGRMVDVENFRMVCDRLTGVLSLKVVSIRRQPLLLVQWKTASQSGDQKGVEGISQPKTPIYQTIQW